ncbi:hypothetical protein [Maribellus mangrovi]|uniref:hypothetical protein n=1 Tax=Maribellus mangrovi TaxID=3133146 RepID=UPI0030EEDDAA
MGGTKKIHFVLALFSFTLLVACSFNKSKSGKIDRYALVTRHNVENVSFDTLSSLTVGNGKFAFTVDATGLQTFPEMYSAGVPLGTMSDWGWHSFPNTENYRLDEAYKYYQVEGREVPYAIQPRESGRKQDAANYFRMNPHRLHLGVLGFDFHKSDGSEVNPSDIKNIKQKLDLWSGVINSSFEIENKPVEVETCSHFEKDVVSVYVNSGKIVKGEIGIKLRLPFPTANWGGDACDWNKNSFHHSEIINQDQNSVVLLHTIDTTTYFIRVEWEGNAQLTEKKQHEFVLFPEKGTREFSASVEFNPENDFLSNNQFKAIKLSSANGWEQFWKSGGAVDFSEINDPRAFELERRIVLSQYLTRVQCAGNFPPQETGLTYNSWYGKPHLEMHWWHGVHFAYWNRTDLLEKSLGYYSDILSKAKIKAEIQGYDGVRWPKMTDRNGDDSPSSVGEFLIWQQPHPIYYAELCYRQNPDKQTLQKYEKLVKATADFMADFARWDAKNDRYILGAPLIPAQESLEREVTINPPFELAYWYWGLSTAQKWQTRLGKPVNSKWQAVIDSLSGFEHKNGLYLAAESAPDSYENTRYYSDHPMVLGAFGIMPETVGIDTGLMANTFDYIEKNWNWESTWGWDYPMAAMSAVRLGKPEKALDLLLKDVTKNTYLKNGHNFQSDRLRIYLPGNGGLLTAVAMMCAGYEGNTNRNPGIPDDWKVKWEGLKPIF